MTGCVFDFGQIRIIMNDDKKLEEWKKLTLDTFKMGKILQ